MLCGNHLLPLESLHKYREVRSQSKTKRQNESIFQKSQGLLQAASPPIPSTVYLLAEVQGTEWYSQQDNDISFDLWDGLWDDQAGGWLNTLE